MADTKIVRILRAWQPVDIDPQQTLLGYLPFYVENVEAERTGHTPSCFSNLSQFHSIPISIVSSNRANRLDCLDRLSSDHCQKMSRPTKKWARAHLLVRPVSGSTTV